MCVFACVWGGESERVCNVHMNIKKSDATFHFTGQCALYFPKNFVFFGNIVAHTHTHVHPEICMHEYSVHHTHGCEYMSKQRALYFPRK